MTTEHPRSGTGSTRRTTRGGLDVLIVDSSEASRFEARVDRYLVPGWAQ